jgi:broad specificity phosphatase PhoE
MPVYVSDLPRALESADVMVASWQGDDEGRASASPGRTHGSDGGTVVISDRRLREIDLGEYEGRTWEEFAADRTLWNAFAAHPFTTALPGGESLATVYERVVAAFREIVATDRTAACVVAHDGPIRTIVNHVLKVPPDRHFALTTSHGGLTLLETSEAWVSVRFVNDTSHLQGLTAAEGPGAPGDASPSGGQTSRDDRSPH